MAARLASSFRLVKRLTHPARAATTRPASMPPSAMAVSDRPATIKPMATPGSTAWLSASPIRLMRRRVRKTPKGAALKDSDTVATSARRIKANSAKGASSRP